MTEEFAKTEIWRLMFNILDQIRFCVARRMPEMAPGKTAGVSLIRVVGCILRNPERQVKIKDIAEQLGITSGGVSQIIDNLVKDGLVERHSDADDRRHVWVSLSAAGEKRRRLLDLFFAELTGRVMEGVEPEKQQVFLEVMRHVLVVLERELSAADHS